MLRVKLWAPGLEGTPDGGHKVQVRRTAAALAATGEVHVQVDCESETHFDDVDLVHGFGLSRQACRQVRSAGIPLVMSTIYWSQRYFRRGPEPVPWHHEVAWRLRSSVELGLAGLRGHKFEKADSIAALGIEMAAIFEMADLLLPNSEGEGRALKKDLGVTTPVLVVPNAVDPGIVGEGGDDSRSGVLMVGRVEPHKNQLALIRACRSLGIDLTLVGPVHKDHTDYHAECRRHERPSGPCIRLLAPVSEESLQRLYRQSTVHALPSYFETTGLASLEAALAGCRIVTTARGYAREYFGEDADYCEPHDQTSISGALRAALARPAPRRLQERILTNFTWEHAAAATLRAYRSLGV